MSLIRSQSHTRSPVTRVFSRILVDLYLHIMTCDACLYYITLLATSFQLHSFMEPHSLPPILLLPTLLFSLTLLAGFTGGIRTGTMVSLLRGLEIPTYAHPTPHRKLLSSGSGRVKPNRIWGEKCSKSDIVINQGPTVPLPSGIPTYTVEIMNMCVSGCDISAIHLRCGWFSSTRLINPKLFKRLHYNDCILNDGRPLINGATISFQYANTFLYPLSVSSVLCV